MSDAKVESIPETLSNLTNLTSLVLKNNLLGSLPESLSTLTKLKLLDVSGNKISSLPNFSQLTQLTTINLSLNSFQGEFNVEGLDKCSKLSVVDLSGEK